MTYSQKNPIAFNEKPASSVKMNEEFVQIYGALNEIDGLKAPLESPALTGNPTAPTAAKETDTTQLATTAFVQDVVADYAPLESPALTGSPTAPTQTASDDSTKIATTAYVKDQVASDTVAGMVELATSAETAAGTDGERAVTPAGFLSGFRGNLLGTVSQSDGVPTGAVIESGSNANGKYVKFADGTLICVGQRESAVSNANFVSVNVSLPATYASTTTQTFSASPITLIEGGAYIHGRTIYTTVSSLQVVFYEMNNTAHTGTLEFSFMCVGRWF